MAKLGKETDLKKFKMMLTCNPMKSSIQVTEIYVYPIKSLGGVSLKKSILTDRGLALDRRWLLVDENGVFITQRTHPFMVHFDVEIKIDGLEVSHKDALDKCMIPFEINDKKEVLNVKVWDDYFEAIVLSKDINTWFSGIFGQKVRLVYQPDSSKRFIDARYAISESDVVSAADGYPVLLVNEASLLKLNELLETPVKMDRFRPNIIVKNLEAFAEDQIGFITNGKVELVGVKNSARCILINNDSEGKMGKEPLKTLSTFRKRNNKVYFGQNMLVKSQGEVAVNDILTLEVYEE